jgi:hypothetical protein
VIASAAGRTDVLPTTLRGPTLASTAAVQPRILEVGVFNTTAVAVAVALQRISATGTVGTALTEVSETDFKQTPIGVVTNTGSTNATAVGSPVRQASLGAAIGSGVIWTFSDQGFLLDYTTGSGLMVICPTGTAQHLDFHFVWRE